ncbi:MAG: ribonuclease HII [Clostridia bacterium]|nr:ribonuclease HII [Clostridia bacterium]MBP3560326.1 ribonuclease HII [Clostridia bacterium]
MLDYSYENNAHNEGYLVVCGVDEAGRGPLAGPVFAGAVILPENYTHEILNDSKKLSEKKRDLVYDDIIRDAVSWSVGMATEQEIDDINILNATFLAMKRAVEGLNIKPDLAFIDGNRYANTGVKEITIVKGDSKCMSVAAASIIAKVSRDRFMQEVDKQYPQYQFSKHKGYGTKLHYEMIEQYGISPVHRKTFLKNIIGK